MIDLSSLFGQIDIYLFDQILRGRIAPGMKIFDAGCGRGRNLVFFLDQGYEVCAVDPDPAAIDHVRPSPPAGLPGCPPRTSGRRASNRAAFRTAVRMSW